MTLPSEQDLEVLVKHLPDFVVVLDARGRFSWVNRTDPTLRMEDVLGRALEYFIAPVDQDRARTAIQVCLSTGEPTYYESLAYGQGAFDTHYGARVVPLPPDTEGRPRVMVLATDVTASRRADERLARSEARFRQLVESSPDWILSIDHTRVVSYANRAMPPLGTPTAEQLVGTRVDRLIDADSRARVVAAIDRALGTGSPGLVEAELSAPGRTYQLRIVPLPPQHGERQALLVFGDVTEERRAASQREVMLAELDHRSKNLLAMVSAIAEQTLLRAESLEGFRDTFGGRIRSLAASHDALAAARWGTVRLHRLVEVVLGPLTDRPCGFVAGACDPALPSQTVTALSLALHELATNALKHGALAHRHGTLELDSDWDEAGRLRIHWRERNVPQPASGSEGGLGIMLVRGLIEHELGGVLTEEVEAMQRCYTLSIPGQTDGAEGRP